MGWSRKCYSEPAEIVSTVFLVFIKNGGRRVNPRFHLLDFDVNQGNVEAC